MEIKKFTQEEYEQLKKEEEGYPVVKRWFKHKELGHYQYQINIMELNEFEEVQ